MGSIWTYINFENFSQLFTAYELAAWELIDCLLNSEDGREIYFRCGKYFLKKAKGGRELGQELSLCRHVVSFTPLVILQEDAVVCVYRQGCASGSKFFRGLSPLHILNDLGHNAKPNKNSDERKKDLITKLRSKNIVYLKYEHAPPAHVYHI